MFDCTSNSQQLSAGRPAQSHSTKSTEFKSQLAMHELIVGLLEPMDFRTISANVAAWKQFIERLVGPA